MSLSVGENLIGVVVGLKNVQIRIVAGSFFIVTGAVLKRRTRTNWLSHARFRSSQDLSDPDASEFGQQRAKMFDGGGRQPDTSGMPVAVEAVGAAEHRE